jgi:single-strand DNA-binding protein
MAGEPIITIVGNIGNDPELRFTPSGAAVCNFSVAVTPRHLDKQANEWRDGEATWYRCAVWRQMAENVAESLEKGMQVIVQGKISNRKYETREGGTGYSLEIDVEHVGPTLRFATAKVTRATRQGGGGQPSGGGGGQQQGGGGYNDPWATPGPGGQGGGQQQGGWGQQGGGNDPWASPGGQGDEPPF